MAVRLHGPRAVTNFGRPTVATFGYGAVETQTAGSAQGAARPRARAKTRAGKNDHRRETDPRGTSWAGQNVKRKRADPQRGIGFWDEIVGKARGARFG